MEKNDKKISKIVKENYEVPDSVNQKMKDAFEKIRNQNIDSKAENQDKERKYKMKKFNIFYKVAAVLGVLFLGGNAIALAFGGDNIYSMIYRMFEPSEEEKIDHVIVEGEKEEVDYLGVESSLGYTIQYDEKSFTLERIGDKDYYSVNIPEVSKMVYFVVYHLDTAYADLKDNNIEETTIGDRNAFVVKLIDGKEYDVNAPYSWDSDVVDTWYIDAGEGTYIVEIHCFMEAVEGWGTRMRQMLNSFKVVE